MRSSALVAGVVLAVSMYVYRPALELYESQAGLGSKSDGDDKLRILSEVLVLYTHTYALNSTKPTCLRKCHTLCKALVFCLCRRLLCGLLPCLSASGRGLGSRATWPARRNRR